MTNSKPSEAQPDPFMVVEELNYEDRTALISSAKSKTQFRVYKPRMNYQFFKIATFPGTTPKELEGNYSTFEKAIKAVESYLKSYRESFAVKSDRLHKERQERHAAKADSSNS
jgi:hypothetical protein